MAIVLSHRARADLDDIRRLTINTWGQVQWLAYYRTLLAGLDQIASHPEAGRDRSLFAPGMRSINCGSHVIFYMPLAAAGGAPVVLRIVHQRRYLPALIHYDDLAVP